jgi:4-hydroxybenzoate polyprenyltransferase
MSSPTLAPVSKSQPDCIVVDLDGTLVQTDTFVATLLEAIRKKPGSLLSLLVALFRGRAECKRLAASLAALDVTVLPYNELLIEYLREQRAYGRRLVLATGADISVARKVANHLGVFHEVIASDKGCNMIGNAKMRAIRECIGEAAFAYAGNSHSDLKVWLHSQGAILVDAPRSCMRELNRAGISVHQDIVSRFNPKVLLRCLRWHQWSKNLLVFLPLVVSHQILNLKLAGWAAIGFLSLSFCASALYIVNDLLDLQADRLHVSKRLRPLASGALTINAGLILAAVMAIAAGGLAWILPVQARLLLATYAFASLVYSLKLKRLLFVDVVSLALFYAMRVLYGGSVTGIKLSIWTVAFSLFLFTSLATVKRLTELRKTNTNVAGNHKYRAYIDADANQLSSLASAAGYAAVLVLALYINSPEVQLLYRHPQGLWLMCPVLIYWISRLTLIANRGELDDDPVAFALQDSATWIAGLLGGSILLFSA